MRRTRWATGVGAGLLALLAAPAVAMADGMTQSLRRNGTPVSTTATDAALFFDNGDIQSRFAEPHRGTFSAWSAADYDDVKVVVLCHKDFLVIFA